MNDNFVGKRGIILDFVSKTSTGKILNIETQKKNSEDMYKKLLYYLAKSCSSQLPRGDKYNQLLQL